MVQKFIAQLLGRIHLEVYVHGNISVERARGLAALLETKFADCAHAVPLLPSELALQRLHELDASMQVVEEKVGRVHQICGICNVYQVRCVHEKTSLHGHLTLLNSFLAFVFVVHPRPGWP